MLDGKSLTVFGVHFPPALHPRDALSCNRSWIKCIEKTEVSTDYQVAIWGTRASTRRETRENQFGDC